MIDDVGQPVLATRLRSDERKIKLTFVVFGIFLVILIINILWVNTLVLQSKSSSVSTVAAITPTITPSPTPCADCISPSPSLALLPVVSTPTVLAKDYFIPLGSGTSNASEWEDVPGVVASVDLGQYPLVQSVVFEVSVSLPSANQLVSVRLFNKTDQHPVWYSDVSMNNANSYLVSAPITYDAGQKLYQVQLKTQLQAPATISQARIHIHLK